MDVTRRDFLKYSNSAIGAGSPADIDLVAANAASREHRDGVAAILAQG